ncbi:MAG: 50S ribosomal protein L23 [Candidatus Pacebacteria bacterium]|nr:50S ribosomal protein L23 [Candidatus Paceibacterota bacterium]
MAINLFKKKETGKAEKKEEKIIEKKEEKEIKPAPKEAKKPAVKAGKVKAAEKTDAWKILKFPHVSERSAMLNEQNFYVFRVFPKANKTEIKKAVEGEYGVNVESVKIINIPRKKTRRGRIEGFRSGYKKALVKVEKGQKIDITVQ